MAKKQVDWTITIAALLAVGSALVHLGILPQVMGGYDMMNSLAISAGLGGGILLATRANIL